MKIGVSLRRLLRRRQADPTPEPEEKAEPEPGPEPEPIAVREPEVTAPPPAPVLVAAPPSDPEPAPEPEPEPAVVPLVLRDPTPRTWNVWELERIARDRQGRDPARDEERSLLFLHMRQFADASGDLPIEFDALVRDTFGADLADFNTAGRA